MVHTLSRYFTYILFTLALITAAYWYVYDPSKILPSVSAMLIVACPCALLLSASYTNGSVMRLLSNNGMYLRDTTVIEQLGQINHIVFDKTGTLTHGGCHYFVSGHQLSDIEKVWIYNVVAPSIHPYSKALAAYLGVQPRVDMQNWREIPGYGVEATVGNCIIKVGSAAHVCVLPGAADEHPVLYIRINDAVTLFYINTMFRSAVPGIVPKLGKRYKLSMLSGDNERQVKEMRSLFGDGTALKFHQKPIDKLCYIEAQQKEGSRVLMLGDGLNDAGALQQSNVGVTLSDDVNNFSPACDAILDAKQFDKFPSLLKLAAATKHIITASFIVSILYNIAGLYFSVQGKMNPMIAAILMPASTLSIVLISVSASSVIARRHNLHLNY